MELDEDFRRRLQGIVGSIGAEMYPLIHEAFFEALQSICPCNDCQTLRGENELSWLEDS